MAACVFCLGKNHLCKYAEGPGCFSVSKVAFDFDIIEILPECIILKIFSFLEYSHLLILRQVSYICRRIAEDPQLWRSLDLSCKRIQESNKVLRIPSHLSKKVRLLNLMWSNVSISAFRRMKEIFGNVEVLLMQHARFSYDSNNLFDSPIPMKLKILDLRSIQARFFDSFNSVTTLLNIESMAVSQTGPSDWLMRISMIWMPKLRIFQVQNNPSLSDAFLDNLTTNCPSLEALCVSGCMYVTGTFLSNITTRIPNLKTLDMNGTRLESPTVQSVDWSLTKIASLNISFCCKLGPLDVERFISQLKHLKHLSASFVGWGKAFTDEVIDSIARRKYLTIETIDLQSTFKLTARGLIKLCSISPMLRHLRVGTLIRTNAGVQALFRNTPNLESFSLQMGDAHFTCKSLFNAFAQHCNNIRTLFVYNMNFQDDSEEVNALRNMLQSCHNLKHFFTGGYPQKQKHVTDTMIKEVARSLNLQINCHRAVKVIPPPDTSFDHHLCDVASSCIYEDLNLRTAIQKSINSKSFYRTSLQRIDI